MIRLEYPANLKNQKASCLRSSGNRYRVQNSQSLPKGVMVMIRFKFSILIVMAMVSSFAASSASAAGYEIWNGSSWVPNGSVHLTGPVNIPLVGIPVSCDADFTLTLVNGTASVTGVDFMPSGLCGSITKVLPWAISAPSALSGTSSVALTIQNISLTYPSTTPPGTCTGTAAGILANANPNSGPANNGFTITGALVGYCNINSRPPGLVSSAPLRATFP